MSRILESITVKNLPKTRVLESWGLRSNLSLLYLLYQIIRDAFDQWEDLLCASTEVPKMACTWFGEIRSCCCLTVQLGPAWVLLSKICIPFSRSLYICRDQGADFNGLTSIFVCLSSPTVPTRAHLLKNVARIPRQRQHRFPLDHGDRLR